MTPLPAHRIKRKHQLLPLWHRWADVFYQTRLSIINNNVPSSSVNESLHKLYPFLATQISGLIPDLVAVTALAAL
jgi:hypothetical protein